MTLCPGRSRCSRNGLTSPIAFVEAYDSIASMPSERRERVERRLAAILAADVAGYSRLVGADEEGTLAALRALRRELIEPGVAAHRGRIVKTTGDGLLVEFASVVDAVTCAAEVQQAVAARNAAVAYPRFDDCHPHADDPRRSGGRRWRTVSRSLPQGRVAGSVSLLVGNPLTGRPV
jgi:hypothetical protein